MNQFLQCRMLKNWRIKTLQKIYPRIQESYEEGDFDWEEFFYLRLTDLPRNLKNVKFDVH